MEQDFPLIPEDLLEALEKRFPDRCPDPQWSERRIWIEVGKREVVKFLKRTFAEQNENILTGN
jgi:hypothetical protein